MCPKLARSRAVQTRQLLILTAGLALGMAAPPAAQAAPVPPKPLPQTVRSPPLWP